MRQRTLLPHRVLIVSLVWASATSSWDRNKVYSVLVLLKLELKKRTIYPSKWTIYPGNRAIYPGKRAIYPGRRTVYSGKRAIYPSYFSRQESYLSRQESYFSRLRVSARELFIPGAKELFILGGKRAIYPVKKAIYPVKRTIYPGKINIYPGIRAVCNLFIAFLGLFRMWISTTAKSFFDPSGYYPPII